MIFNRKKKKAVPQEVNYPSFDYPNATDMYSISYEEYGGLLPIHSMKISFVLPYNDWCEFEKSNLYKHLLQYLQELQKRDNRLVMKALED